MTANAAAESGPRRRWADALAGGAPLLADGGMGTMLFAAGLEFGDPPETWNVDNAAAVRAVHRDYLAAGSRILLTNTFGANRLRMDRHGLGHRVDELNRAAVALLRDEVEQSGTGALVAGDIGPTGAMMAPLGALTEEAATDIFAEQAAALVGAGVDLVWIETMADLDEVRAAVAGVRRVASTIPLIATMTFDTHGRTMMGVTPERAAHELAALGVDAFGGNCGNGPDELLPVIERMRAAAPQAILVAKPNAGMPRMVDGRTVYDATPASMAIQATLFRDAGTTIIGACCGSMPAHLAAMRAALIG
jgi:methionine synthase I (cobalamin-dependent)